MNNFHELQSRIRQILISEKLFYQKTKHIYTTSIDYNLKDKKSIAFFKIVQNKLILAILQNTAAALVYRRVDASLTLLEMKSYDKANPKAVTKQEVSIAKNYLDENEMKLIGLLV